jgi:hypothetical protein
MNVATPEATADNAASMRSDETSNTGNAVEQQRLLAQADQTTKQKIEIDAERIRSSVARLSSSSSAELEGLASELQKLDEFLKSETGRVQREIESALAGIRIIIEAIAPWKRPASRAVPVGARNHTPVAFGDARSSRQPVTVRVSSDEPCEPQKAVAVTLIGCLLLTRRVT